MVKRYKTQAARRKIRVRSGIKGSHLKPRLTVFRSLKAIYAQIIDDQKGTTLVSATSLKLELNSKNTSKTASAKAVGQALAKAALKRKISQVVFDRGQYQYHGRVKALADAARAAGLKF